MDHIDNDNKSDWFKDYVSFSSKHSGFPTGIKLRNELKKCQTLCVQCHSVKTYIEKEERHSLTKHKLLHQHYPHVVKWYIEKYSSDPKLKTMLSHLTSERSKTDEFVFIDSDKPFKRREVKGKKSQNTTTTNSQSKSSSTAVTTILAPNNNKSARKRNTSNHIEQETISTAVTVTTIVHQTTTTIIKASHNTTSGMIDVSAVKSIPTTTKIVAKSTNRIPKRKATDNATQDTSLISKKHKC